MTEITFNDADIELRAEPDGTGIMITIADERDGELSYNLTAAEARRLARHIFKITPARVIRRAGMR